MNLFTSPEAGAYQDLLVGPVLKFEVKDSNHSKACASLPTYIHTYLHIYLPTYLPTSLPTYLHTYLHTIPTYYTYLPTYLPTYIHTYIHIHTHRYIDTHTFPTMMPNFSINYFFFTIGSNEGGGGLPRNLTEFPQDGKSGNRLSLLT